MTPRATSDIWPEKITEWRCPVCGALLTGRVYNLDTARKKCSAKWHKAVAVGRVYLRSEEKR